MAEQTGTAQNRRRRAAGSHELGGTSAPPEAPGKRGGRSGRAELSGVTLPMWASRWWLLVLPLALIEVVALGVRVSRVPLQSDWRRAATYVREHYQGADAIVAAPGWADPTLRLHLGDRIGLDVAGRSDLARFERLWVLATRGARADDEPARTPDETVAFDRVTVRRYDLGASPVLVDLRASLPEAEVFTSAGGRDVPCRHLKGGHERAAGGLFFGPVRPNERFQCNVRKPWNYVGATVTEDLDLKPRHCIWQHPVGNEPVSVVYRDVPLGRLVLHGGLYYHHERELRGAPVHVRVRVDGRVAGEFDHHDGDGFARHEVDTRAGRAPDAPGRGDVRIEVTTQAPHLRSFCWDGVIVDPALADARALGSREVSR